jgi:hypothetical protein
MPTTKRKRVVLIENSDTLLQAVKHDPNRQVYYLHQTGEIFETYECVRSLIHPCPLTRVFVERMLRACPSTDLSSSNVK